MWRVIVGHDLVPGGSLDRLVVVEQDTIVNYGNVGGANQLTAVPARRDKKDVIDLPLTRPTRGVHHWRVLAIDRACMPVGIGDVIIAKPNGWRWGKKECLPSYYIIKIPDLSVKEAESYLEVWNRKVEYTPTFQAVDGATYKVSATIESVSQVEKITPADALSDADGIEKYGIVTVTDMKDNDITIDIDAQEYYRDVILQSGILSKTIKRKNWRLPQSSLVNETIEMSRNEWITEVVDKKTLSLNWDDMASSMHVKGIPHVSL